MGVLHHDAQHCQLRKVYEFGHLTTKGSNRLCYGLRHNRLICEEPHFLHQPGWFWLENLSILDESGLCTHIDR
ncbi:unnamed protein product [Caenorhabditis angaria]|uniref:Uncharacterized protein n=1 Tax=Caenorhabditis angaria TaxID=860376 RepID=A0A9P1IYQ1_9PELO|nr:unnamed protein product [Caenorhabditis angaria]